MSKRVTEDQLDDLLEVQDPGPDISDPRVVAAAKKQEKEDEQAALRAVAFGAGIEQNDAYVPNWYNMYNMREAQEAQVYSFCMGDRKRKLTLPCKDRQSLRR